MAQATELLKWYGEMGVDEAIDDAPRDWFAQIAAKAPVPDTPPAPRPVAAAPTPISLKGPAAAVKDARAVADACTTREELEKALREFDGCSLRRTASNTVFCDGNPNARVMFVGEAPGAEEDKQGIPFCGPSGQLLDRMLSFIGLTRANFYISNTLFWRPPGNRKPSTEELAICRPFVEKHIALINPDLLVLVGGTATTALLDETRGISRLRGKFYTYSNPYTSREIPVAVLFHPSYLLRQPSHKRLAWQDILAIKHYMREHGISPEPR
ncbi:MAG: uracil-DNA glycosylase [Alphaproteobacteria bacterium]|nr:uracil-DNA glycosylase [Alphaproteobacteria bacterium]